MSSADPDGVSTASARPDTRTEDEFWRDVLLEEGVAAEEIEKARVEGPLQLYALERYILEESPQVDLASASRETGIPEDRLRTFWCALGFPDPLPDEPTFTRRDLRMLETIVRYIDDGILDETVALQMARVMGLSLARIAVAQVEASQMRRRGAFARGPRGRDAEEAAEVKESAELIPMLSALLESVWRRHLAVAARRRTLQDDDEREREITVGFADLEGFTSLSEQLPEHELAELVDRFEQLAYEIVARHDGRVVKTIGDEVMFVAESPAAGAELALSLAESYGADDALGDVRVGLATGRGLQLEGDLYGPAVNMASRIVSIAYPGTVVVSEEVHDALADYPEYALRSIRPHYLRHIGRVPLWVLRRAGDLEQEDEGWTLRRARERRAARRAWIAERMAGRSVD